MQVLRKIVSRPIVLVIALASVLTMVGCGGSSSSSSSTNATATPTFSPGAGSYNASQTVTIADATPGAVLYCTTDGSMPTTSSPKCSQPTTVFQSEFLQAMAVAPNTPPSMVASAGYTIDLNAAATPTFSPAGGSYSSAQSVTIKDATSGANIYYTTDGTVPTANSMLYTGPVMLAKSATLSAIAVASGFSNSGVASAAYVIGTGTAAPVISPAGGTFSVAQSVTIADATTGASIYYTVDGSTPTSSSTAYTGAINVSSTETINAIAIASGNNSSVTTAAFTINIPVTPVTAAPTFSPAAGTFTSAQTVMLADTTPGAVIYYTIDGSMPTTSSPVYSSGINVAATETIKTIAIASGFTASAVTSATYTINGSVAAPTFSVAGGSYITAQSVTISDTTSGASIYYTTDGSTPAASSTPYTTPISVSTTETLNAIAVLGGNLSPVTAAAYTINTGPVLSGTVVSGTLPVNGATVQMYAAGSGGYASSASLLTTTAVMTGSDGSFKLTYSCPAAGGDLVYVVATGGHTGSNTTSNTGLAFMAALGSCNGTLPATLVVNEVTTVASAYALSQFMTGAGNVGSSATNYEQGATSAPGLANAFAAVNNLVDLTTGTVLTNTPDYPTNLAGDTNLVNNSTVPTARINTLANILNACAADGSGCSGLFSAATPSSGTAPSDTLQAILNIAQNPGSNVAMVYNVVTGSGPFTPSLTAVPNDWTLALTFTGGGLGFTPGFEVPNTGGAGPNFSDGRLVNTAMAIDATGNVWVTGFNNSRSSNTPSSPSINSDLVSGMIAQFSNTGKPLTKPSSASPQGTVTYGGYIPINKIPTTSRAENGGTLNPLSIAFDPSGNAWVVGGSVYAVGAADGSTSAAGGAMSEISPNLAFTIPYISLGGEGTSNSIAIDGVGNLWTFGYTPYLLTEFNNSGIQVLSNPGAIASQGVSGYFGAQSLTFDSNAASLWGSSSDGFGDLFQANPSDGSNTVDYYWTASGQYTPLVAGPALSAGTPGNVYGCGDAPGQTLDVYNVSSTSIITTYPIPTGRGCGNQMVLDGAGHIFTLTGGVSPGIIDEFTLTGKAISPTTGYTGTSSGESPTINPDSAAPVPVEGFISNAGVAAAAIDGSGNLWVLNADTGTTASPGNVLVEYIGLAAPVVTPTSLALQFGEVGLRP